MSKPTGKLYALSDLHLGSRINQEAITVWGPHPDDGLILCGDVGETAKHLELAFTTTKAKFAEVFWCPGNHELYTLPPTSSSLSSLSSSSSPSSSSPSSSSAPTPSTEDSCASGPARGEAKYQECVQVARRHGVWTPEDEFFLWEGAGGPVVIALLFTLYDYSFRPAHLATDEDALKWAAEGDTVATDEYLLHPDPYPSRPAWCRALVSQAAARLRHAAEQRPGVPLVVANHWPLREDLVFIPRIPRFSLWCGTRLTEDWHTRFGRVAVVVSGHLHVPRTDWKDGTRFEEVSLGYPRQWEGVKKSGKGVEELMREILPGEEEIPPIGTGEWTGPGGCRFRRWG